MKKLLKLFNIGIFLFLGGVVNAETDLLGLANLAEGNSPSYGEGVVVGMFEDSGAKYITSAPQKSGKLKFPINLSGDFEIEFRIYKDSSRKFELYLNADERHIKITTGKWDFSYDFGTDSQNADSDQSKAFTENRTNKFKLSVSNNVAKMYVNDVYSRKVTLTPNLTYTQLLVHGIESGDVLHSLVVGGNVSTPSGNTGGDFDSGKQAGIQQCVSDPASCGITVTATCDGTTPTTSGAHASYNPANGEVHIPFIDVPGPFGDQQVYEVFLIQQPSTFSFDLDLNRLNLRQ
jgi:hypothetical protein